MNKKQGSIIVLAVLFFLLFQVGKASAFSVTEFIDSLLQRNQPASVGPSLGADALGAVSTNGTVTATAATAPQSHAPDCKVAFFTQTLKAGQHGDQVKALQSILIDAGYLSQKGADGSFGAKTGAALKAYQKANGVSVTGSTGSTVRAKLNEVWKNECVGSDESVASNSAVKRDLANAQAQAALYYSANASSYAGVCTVGAVAGGVVGVHDMVLGAANVANLSSITINGTGTITTSTCNENGTAWAAESPLTGGDLYCVDSKGTTKETKTSIGSTTNCQ